MAEVRKKIRNDVYKQRQYATYRNPVPRQRTVRTLDESERRRLDNVLLTTDTPIVFLAKRFDLPSDQLHERLRELGFKTKPASLGIQERVPLDGVA